MGKHPGAVCSEETLRIDYAEYLAALCNKRWRFIDAMYGVLPIIGMVTKSSSARQIAPEEQMKMLAMQVLSTQVNDETNLTRLITLAQQQGLTTLDIRLPYSLSARQLASINDACATFMTVSLRDECLRVEMTPTP